MKQLNDEILKSTNEMWADRPVVFGDGDKNAIIMLIGEAPGAEEVIDHQTERNWNFLYHISREKFSLLNLNLLLL